MGDRLLELWRYGKLMVELPRSLKELFDNRQYRRGVITFGCSGLVAITRVRWEPFSAFGPWEVVMDGISLIDGQTRQESSDCRPDLVEPYTAQVLVGCQLGLSWDDSMEHLRLIQKQSPELCTLWS